MSHRDDQLRASILTHCRLMGQRAGDGWVSIAKLAIAARDDHRQPVDDEAHASRLVEELTERGLLTEKRQQPGAESQDLRYRQVRITDMEWQRFTGQIDPIPGVADRRHN